MNADKLHCGSRNVEFDRWAPEGFDNWDSLTPSFPHHSTSAKCQSWNCELHNTVRCHPLVSWVNQKYLQSYLRERRMWWSFNCVGDWRCWIVLLVLIRFGVVVGFVRIAAYVYFCVYPSWLRRMMVMLLVRYRYSSFDWFEDELSVERYFESSGVVSTTDFFNRIQLTDGKVWGKYLLLRAFDPASPFCCAFSFQQSVILYSSGRLP